MVKNRVACNFRSPPEVSHKLRDTSGGLPRFKTRVFLTSYSCILFPTSCRRLPTVVFCLKQACLRLHAVVFCFQQVAGDFLQLYFVENKGVCDFRKNPLRLMLSVIQKTVFFNNYSTPTESSPLPSATAWIVLLSSIRMSSVLPICFLRSIV